MFFSIFEGQQIGFWTRESFCTCASIVEGQWWCDSVAKSVKSQFYNTLRQLQKIIKRREVSPKLVFFPVWKRGWTSFQGAMSRGVANWLPVQIPQDKLVDPWKFFHIGLKLGIKSGGAALYPCSSIFNEISVRKFHSTIVLILKELITYSYKFVRTTLPNWNKIWSSILISILLQFHKILRKHKAIKKLYFLLFAMLNHTQIKAIVRVSFSCVIISNVPHS